MDIRKIRLFVSLSLLFVIFLSCLSPAASAEKGEKIPIRAARAIAKAQALAAEKKPDKALALLEKFRAKANGGCGKEKPASFGYCHFQVDFNMGNMRMMLGDHKGAAACYRTALRGNPLLSSAWLNLAAACYDLELSMEASKAFIKGYETAEKKKPEHLYYGAVCGMMGKDNSGAVKIFDRLLKDHPGALKTEWRETLVSLLMDMKEERAALPHIERLARDCKGKKKIRWQETLLYQYMGLELKDKAFSYVRFLTESYPLEPKWWKGLAHFHLMENRLKQALVALTVYGGLTPLTEKEQKLSADLNFSLGIPVEGVRNYGEMIEKKGELPVEWVKRVSRGYLALHKPETALSWVDRGLSVEEEPELLILKANILYELSRFSEAGELFLKIARKKKKGCARAWMMAGYSALNTGDIPNAGIAFKNAAGFSSRKKEANKILGQLKQYQGY